MDEGDRQNLIVGVVVVALILATAWVITAIKDNGRLEECLQQRRRNCEQVLR